MGTMIENLIRKTVKKTNSISEATGDKEAYQKFFKSALKKFGVSEPDQLEGKKKKEFFDYIDKNWESDDEEAGIQEATVTLFGKFGSALKIELISAGEMQIVAGDEVINIKATGKSQGLIKDVVNLGNKHGLWKGSLPVAKLKLLNYDSEDFDQFVNELEMDKGRKVRVTTRESKKMETMTGDEYEAASKAKVFDKKAWKYNALQKFYYKESVDLEEAAPKFKGTNKLSANEYEKFEKLKSFNKADWKWDPKEGLYVRVKLLGEAQESKVVPFKKLEQAWARTNGDKKKQAKLIAKYDLDRIISKVRPGAVKLGVENKIRDLKYNATVAGVDENDDLIFVTNNPMRVIYPKKSGRRPEGKEMTSYSIDQERIAKMIELSTHETRPAVIREAIDKHKVTSSSSMSEIRSAINVIKGEYK